MSLLLTKYMENLNIPFSTIVTTLTLDSVKVIILEFGKVSWFENRMENPLINPNQCQNFGIQICNDLTDPHRKLRIEASEYIFIPMTMEGSTCGIVTHPTTDNDLHECQRICLSDEFDQGPSKNVFQISSMEEEFRTRSSFCCYINIVESRIPSSPPTIQCIYYSGIHIFHKAMANVSNGLAQDLVVGRLISNVRVRRKRSGCTTYTYKQRHGISADLLSRKWGIGLD